MAQSTRFEDLQSQTTYCSFMAVDDGSSGLTGLVAALPEYEIVQELGRGAMGVVLLARHRSLDRLVAIKELPSSLAADDAVRARFLDEARAVASLAHPHVVTVHDFIDRDGHLALVMEQLPGGTVWDRFTSTGITQAQACGLVLATGSGVQHAHDQGLIHRDIKPENLMFAADGQLKVTDFGIAAVLNGETTMSTASGQVVGTPAYMSPEQARGEPVDGRADVYACATVLFELLSGRLPFDAKTSAEMLEQRRTAPAPSLGDVAPQTPPSIARAVNHGLAIAASDRPGSVREFAESVGLAAADAWGPEWLGATGTPVLGADSIVRAARTTGASGQAVAAASPVAAAPAAPAAAVPAAQVDPHAVIRAKSHDRVRGADLHNLDPAGFVPLSARAPAGSSLVPFIAALLAAAGAVLMALQLAPQTVDAEDQTLAVTATLTDESPAELPVLDFEQAINLGGSNLVGPVTVRPTLLGIPLGSVEGAGSGSAVSVDADWLRWTTTGFVRLDAVVDGVSVGSADVDVRQPPWYLTAAPWVAGMAGLIAWSIVMSNRQRLRRNQKLTTSFLGMGLGGAMLGPMLVIGAAIARIRPAQLTTAIACAVLCAVAALALGETTRRRGIHRRAKVRGRA